MKIRFGLDDGTDGIGLVPLGMSNDAAHGDGQVVSTTASLAKITPTVPVSTTPTHTLYLTEPGDTAAISVNDLHQGQLGDCYLISAIGELALFHPAAISNMIHANSNGTETVTLYEDKSGNPLGWNTTSFKPVLITVSNTFSSAGVNNQSTQDVVGGKKEIWAQVLEKAFATLNGGYAAIGNGGNPVLAMEALTGHAATWMPTASLSLAALRNDIAAGDLIAMDTPNKSSLPDNLVGNHAYMFESLSVTNGTTMVHLGNPWGTDQPQAIPFAQLSKGIAEVDIGRFA